MPLRGAELSRRVATGDRRVLVLLLALPLASGFALVIHILAGIDLRLAAAVLVALGLVVWGLIVPRLPADRRSDLRRRVRVGAGCGVLATLAYDTARYGTVAVADLSFQPFHVFSIFGTLFLGPGASPTAAFLVGALYHLLNGTGFGVAYVLAVRRPGVVTGMLWGVLLELSMALLYPSWLRIQQLGEFLQVSAVGHLVYGAVLGSLAGRLVTGPARGARRQG